MSANEAGGGLLQRLSNGRYVVVGIMAVAIGLALLFTLISSGVITSLLVLLIFIASAVTVSGLYERQYRACQAALLQCQMFEAVLRETHVGMVFNSSPSEKLSRSSTAQPIRIVGYNFEPERSGKTSQVSVAVHAYQAGLVAQINETLNFEIIQKQDQSDIDKTILERRQFYYGVVFVKFLDYSFHELGQMNVKNVTILQDVSEQTISRNWLRGFQQLAAELAKVETVEQIASIIMKENLSSNGIVTCSLYFADDEEQALRLVSHQGLAHPHRQFPVSDVVQEAELNFIVDSYSNGHPIWVSNSEDLTSQFGLRDTDDKVMEAYQLSDMVAIDRGQDHYFAASRYRQGAWILKAALAIPLWIEGRKIGVLAAGAPVPIEFSKIQRELAVMIAGQCEQVIRRIRAEIQARESAALQERHRLARDLHDAVSQTLFSATLSAETLLLELEQQPENLRPHLERLVELTQGAFAEMRTLLVELRPEAILKAPLSDLLQHLIVAARVRKKIEGELWTEGLAQALPAEAQIALYRVAQESINNVLKHSQATMFRVELAQEDDWIKLRIKDDGRGFDTTKSFAGIGLGSMRERAEEIGGEMKIVSSPGEGTTITVSYPMMKEK